MSVCFYHRDADGRCAGAIVKAKFPDCKMHSIDYRDEFPLDTIKSEEQVFIVDFSIEPEMMRSLIHLTGNIVWIDHHKTAIAKYLNFQKARKFTIPGIRDVKHSGCMLTWMYYHPGEDPPWAVKLIEDWDIWKFDYENTLPFISGLSLYDASPESALWDELLIDDNLLYPSGDLIRSIISDGRIVQQYHKCHNRQFLKEWGYSFPWESLHCVAVNRAKCSSVAFESVKDKYEMYIAYIHDGEKYTVTLYTDIKEIDVSKIATRYGGGGHKNAAGFVCESLPWLYDGFKHVEVSF